MFTGKVMSKKGTSNDTRMKENLVTHPDDAPQNIDIEQEVFSAEIQVNYVSIIINSYINTYPVSIPQQTLCLSVHQALYLPVSFQNYSSSICFHLCPYRQYSS